MALKIDVPVAPDAWSMKEGRQGASRDAAGDFFDQMLQTPGSAAAPKAAADASDLGLLRHAEEIVQGKMAPADPSASGDLTGQGAREVAAVELHPLGLLPGLHLSYITHRFMVASGEAALLAADGEGAAVTARPVQGLPGGASAAMQLAESEQMATLLRSDNMTGDSVQIMEAGLESRSWLERYLSRQWPERRFQIVKRDDGWEIYVRDYQLQTADVDRLLAGLQQTVLATGQQLGRLWLNGTLVWTADAATESFARNYHAG